MKTGVVTLLLLMSLLVLTSTRTMPTMPTVNAEEQQIPILGNNATPQYEELKLYCLYNNGTLDKNASWENISWAQVNQVGIKNPHSISGFEATYGSIVWYPITGNRTYDKPVFYTFERFWAKVNGTWYGQFLTKNSVSKAPSLHKPYFNKWNMGWNGMLTVGSHNFPVYVGIQVRSGTSPTHLKTNVTTPINLEDHGIEYLLYLNPQLAGLAEKNVKWARVYFKDGNHTDYPISGSTIDLTYSVPNGTRVIGFLNEQKTLEICTFDFYDVFTEADTKFISLESETLPNGMDTYVLKVRVTLGSLTAGETMVIDPNFGYATVGTEYELSIKDNIVGSKFTATANMTVDTIHAYIIADTTKYVKTAIYDVDVDSFLEESDEVQVTASAGGWETFSLTGSVSLTDGTQYYMCAWSDNMVDIRIAADDGDTGQTLNLSLNYNDEEGEFPADLFEFDSANYVCSIYTSYDVPTYSTWVQPLDAGGTGLIFETNVTVTLDNGTSYEDATEIIEQGHPETWMASFSVPAGTHSVKVEWGDHLVAQDSIIVTKSWTHYITTKIRSLTTPVAENDTLYLGWGTIDDHYLYFSVNNTDIPQPELWTGVVTDPLYNWRIESITGSGNVEFKMYNQYWTQTGEPYSFNTADHVWTTGTGTWDFSNYIFTFTLEFSTLTVSMSWDEPETPPSEPTGSPPGGPTETPEEPTPEEPTPEFPTPETEPQPTTPPGAEPLLIVGAAGIIVTIGFIITYGEISRRNPSTRKAMKNRAKEKRVKFPKEKK